MEAEEWAREVRSKDLMESTVIIYGTPFGLLIFSPVF